MTGTTEPPGEVVSLSVVPIGWTVKIKLESRIGGFALVGRCSCEGNYATRKHGGDGAWERMAKDLGQHVKDRHGLEELRWA